VAALTVAGQVDRHLHVLYEGGGAVEHGHHDVKCGFLEAGQLRGVLVIGEHVFEQESDFVNRGVVARHIDSL
jgi:hypothetical protein